LGLRVVVVVIWLVLPQWQWHLAGALVFLAGNAFGLRFHPPFRVRPAMQFAAATAAALVMARCFAPLGVVAHGPHALPDAAGKTHGHGSTSSSRASAARFLAPAGTGWNDSMVKAFCVTAWRAFPQVPL
jgi:hypothetical protein